MKELVILALMIASASCGCVSGTLSQERFASQTVTLPAGSYELTLTGDFSEEALGDIFVYFPN